MLLASLLVANLIGVAGYGRYALLQSTILLLAGLAQISFAVVIAQQVSSLRERNPALAGEVAAFCFLVAAVLSILFTAGLLIGREPLADGLFKDPALSRGLALAALAIPWLAASAIQQGLFSGLERFREQATVAILLSPFVIALPAAGAVEAGFEGALVGLGLAYLLRCVVGQFMIIRIFRSAGISWSLANLRTKFRLVVKYALPATLAGVLTALAIWGGQTLLVRTDGGSTALGLFAAAYAVKTMVMFVPMQMMSALLPILSRFNANPEARRRRGLLYLNLAGSLFVTVTLAAIGVLLAPDIMGLFGPGFSDGSSTLILLLIATPLEAMTITLYQDIQSRGRFWSGLWSVSVPLSFTAIAAAALLVPGLREDGLATAWLIAWSVGLVCTIFAVSTQHLQSDR